MKDAKLRKPQLLPLQQCQCDIERTQASAPKIPDWLQANEGLVGPQLDIISHRRQAAV
jgi:hypothetical protein